MATILDIIRNRKPVVEPQQAQTLGTNQTEQLQLLSRATSGKAGSTQAAPRISNIGEQLAVQQTQQQLAQVAGQEQLQQVEQEGQAQQLVQQDEFAQREMGEQTAQFMTQLAQNQLALLDQYDKGERQLDLKKDKARLEQVGFTLRLNNDKYINKLQEEGFRARLDNELRFSEELARTMFADELEMLQNDLEFRAMIGANDRDFANQMAGMDLDFAMSLAKTASDTANAQQMWGGIGTVLSGGIQAYGAGTKIAAPETPVQETISTEGTPYTGNIA